MLKERLEQENKHLYLNIGHTHVSRITVEFEAMDQLLSANHPGPHEAYFLPWKEDQGLYTDLPVPPTGNDPVLFLTANLSGCCVGVQNFGGFIRVRHYNLATTETDRPIFMNDDLFRYGTNTAWLLPSDKYNVSSVPRAHGYTHAGIGGNEAAFWGEYEARYWPFTSKWHFYYQNGGFDTVIHELNYQ